MQAIESKERIRLMQDGTIHALGLVLSSVAGLLLVPIMVRGLGAERYGLWMASVAAIGIFGAFDLGLRLIIVREIAGELRPERAPVLRMMFWLHVGLGPVAAGIVAVAGIVASRHLHLSSAAQAVAPSVFLFGAGSCFFDQIFLYVLSVWAGLRRFHLLNSYSVAASILRIVLFASALAAGKGILVIAALNLVISAASAVSGLMLIFATIPDLCPKWESFNWKLLRESLGFGALSQAATSIASLQMSISTLLISVINGAAAVTPFTVGQKFPNLLSGLTWRTSEVFFPVASRQGTADKFDSEQFLGAIARWLMLAVVPAAIGLFLIAPALLRAWMGSVDPTALAIVRLASLSVVVEILIPGAVQLFWGAGQTKVVLIVNLATLATDVILAIILLPRIGPVGAVWATLGSTAIAVVLLLVLVSRERRVRVLVALQGTARRMVPALAVSLVPVFILQRMIAGRNWPAVVGVVLLSTVLYVFMLWRYTATEDEKLLLAKGLRFGRD
jgi:O-antigen/teichoic acid export membrane protein